MRKNHRVAVLGVLTGLALFAAFVCAGCCSTVVDEQYLKADRATYDAVADEWVASQEDDVLRELAKLVVKSWLERIVAAEKALDVYEEPIELAPDTEPEPEPTPAEAEVTVERGDLP